MIPYNKIVQMEENSIKIVHILPMKRERPLASVIFRKYPLIRLLSKTAEAKRIQQINYEKFIQTFARIIQKYKGSYFAKEDNL